MTETRVLKKLADHLRRRNSIDDEIAAMIDRPAHSSHLGEFVAAEIFNIKLAESAVQKGSDGHFISGPITGRSVNVKKYSLDNCILAIRPNAIPDYYLVLTGPRSSAMSSRGTSQPWTIEAAYLFKANPLIQDLRQRGIKLNERTSVRRQYWDEAQIYPTQANRTLVLTPDQKRLLALFAGDATRKDR